MFPNIPHLPFSPALEGEPASLEGMLGRQIVVLEKLDGEPVSMSSFHIQGKEKTYGATEPQSYMLSLHAGISSKIPEGMTVYGENMYAVRNIEYPKLNSYFYGTAMVNNGIILDWATTMHWCVGILKQSAAPIITNFKLSTDKEEALAQLKEIEIGHQKEGYVVRTVGSFPLSDLSQYMAQCSNRLDLPADWETNWKRAILAR